MAQQLAKLLQNPVICSHLSALLEVLKMDPDPVSLLAVVVEVARRDQTRREVCQHPLAPVGTEPLPALN